MKGTKDEPKCKHSKLAIKNLNDIGLKYNTFDILSNKTIREKMKEKCPTYPQLWYKYNYVCNGDKLKEENIKEYLSDELGKL